MKGWINHCLSIQNFFQGHNWVGPYVKTHKVRVYPWVYVRQKKGYHILLGHQLDTMWRCFITLLQVSKLNEQEDQKRGTKQQVKGLEHNRWKNKNTKKKKTMIKNIGSLKEKQTKGVSLLLVHLLMLWDYPLVSFLKQFYLYLIVIL
jgi:hypothetical protein